MSKPFSRNDQLRLAFRFCRAPVQILAYVLRGITLASVRRLPLRPYILCAVAKTLQDVFDAHDIQYLCNPTKQVYETWIKEKLFLAKDGGHQGVNERLKCDIEPLTDGHSSILWLGDRTTAKKIVLFFHGGGYTTPLLNGYMEWMWRAHIMAGIDAEIDVAVAILEYSLSPGAQYPTQLCQAAAALEHLLRCGISPENIIIGGDSAGGNLTGQLLCHIVQPHPEAIPVKLAKPLAGVFLVSPWLTKRTNHTSFAENGSIDMLSASLVNLVLQDLLGLDWAKQAKDSFSHAFPLDMSEPWIESLNTITKNMYLSVGYHEVFRDQCVSFVEEVRERNPNLELYFDLQEQMAHDFILLEGEDKRDGECIKAMKKWMKGVLLAGAEAN
ncbi:hypothetical protein CkaCkLH20_03690 [Colletotrichum karsti]|uniref:Alpha/beta hydrolase fold-3 domain-containing protein n=1 Tax=Colletotrichum karsti TaxID=1095194 RepID=A0A9P6LMT7_9PEZI|nr:uncharacterized protein CkaCkLH20_03690 [Colletotrichum karsti]KAF9878790.1 hypothetical protein CkaCkLH20_03690 [Colletotrichum karsti]